MYKKPLPHSHIYSPALYLPVLNKAYSIIPATGPLNTSLPRLGIFSPNQIFHFKKETIEIKRNFSNSSISLMLSVGQYYYEFQFSLFKPVKSMMCWFEIMRQGTKKDKNKLVQQ